MGKGLEAIGNSASGLFPNLRLSGTVHTVRQLQLLQAQPTGTSSHNSLAAPSTLAKAEPTIIEL